MFDDILGVNRTYAAEFTLAGLDPRAAKGLGVVTCIDARIEPLAMLGLVPGDATVLRNAGGRVSDDVLRSLALATHLLGVTRICVVQHTRCRMVGATNEEIRATIGPAAVDRDFLPIDDQHRTLADDVRAVRECPLIPPGVTVAGFVYDVDTGLLDHVTA
ncbi:MAG: beta-class carbonic anhydrase [Actinomycetes bacterium]